MTTSCETVEPLLAELASLDEREAPPKALVEAARHATSCDRCAAHLTQLRSAVRLMERAGQVSLPSGFERELHRKLVAADPPVLSPMVRLTRWTRLHPLAGLGSAAALSATLSVAAAVAILPRGTQVTASNPSGPAVADAAPRFRVPAQKVALVKIDFDSAKAIDDVDFEILLPDGLHFYSGGRELAERTFQWRAKLGAGSNVVPIAVKGSRPGRYRVIAHATGEDLDVSQEVLIEVTT